MSPRRRFRTLPLSASGYFQASSLARRLAGTSGRIEFVILRTGHSPPVALHPVSRRMRLRSVTGRRVRAWRGLSPLSSCTLASARAPASLPALSIPNEVSGARSSFQGDRGRSRERCAWLPRSASEAVLKGVPPSQEILRVPLRTLRLCVGVPSNHGRDARSLSSAAPFLLDSLARCNR